MESEFIALIKRHEATIYKVCWMFAHNDKEIVCDLYQEIVLHLWKGYSTTYHSENKDNSWIFRISLNTAISYQRYEKKHVSLLDINMFDEQLAETESDKDVEQLYSLIEQLNDVEKAMVYLYLEKKSHEEISKIIGITVSNVGTRLQRIKQKLKILNKQNK